MSIHLYQLSAEFAALSDVLTGDEIPPDIEAGIDALNLAIEAKVGGCVQVWRSMEAEAEAYRGEARRLAAMAQAREKAAERLKAYVSRSLDTAGIARVVTDVGKVSVGNASRPSIRWTRDVEELPAELVRFKTELNGTAAYDAWKIGMLPDEGFEVTTSRVVRVS